MKQPTSLHFILLLSYVWVATALNSTVTTSKVTEMELLSVSSTTQQTTTAIPTARPIHDTSYIWTNDDLDEGNSIIFSVCDGCYISATVYDVDMSDRNYLLLVGGSTYNADLSDGRVFANTVKGPMKYLFETSFIYAFCENSKGTDDRTIKFKVEFEQVDKLTTTEPTTTSTTMSVPPTEKTDSVFITVNVTGKLLSDYTNPNGVVINDFRNCTVTMAMNYCQEQSIVLENDITYSYVMISEITHCPYNWPHSLKCVQITLKLPIFYQETEQLSGYQLNTKHLESMWSRWSELDEGCFGKHSFDFYTEPKIGRNIVLWAIGISLIIFSFGGLLWFFQTTGGKFKYSKKIRNRKSSDTKSIVSKRMNSISSMAPHYLQD